MSFDELEAITKQIDITDIKNGLVDVEEIDYSKEIVPLLNEGTSSFPKIVESIKKIYQDAKKNGKTDVFIGNYYISANKKFMVKYEDDNVICIVDSTYGTHYEQHLNNEEKNFVIILPRLESKRLGSELIINKAIYDIIPKIYYKKETTVVDDVINEDITLVLSDEAVDYGIDRILAKQIDYDEFEDNQITYHIEKNAGEEATHPSDIINVNNVNEYYPMISDNIFARHDEDEKLSVTMNKVYDNNHKKYNIDEVNKIVEKTQRLYSAFVRSFE